MKLFRMAAVLLAVLAGPAYAQMPNLNLLQEGPGKTPEEKAAEAERDKAYKETLKKIPDAKASNDPWGGMRSDPPKQAAPKASAATTGAPKKTKTGTAAN
ncbi:hypothetical protein ACVIWV_001699 [Bradyrhizobium diazoefficiens]|jgi:hypothetical protein|uniref:Uncharacterized protein n=2 Tax=Bradyrhizobium diazoefficiens TaxID=1355477 RepID=A0A837CBC2_9BRAD|nr:MULTISPECIES: hypothetical protein [Bradyrhizobium]MBP1064044.1 hypothetical protein [Bradyrhizobium japonicum]AND90924.1 hypothetical protein AAV28_26340 [Bradyrhizobium diazoefficiens USDA 110]APO51943.1 hypothetical protein BD122_16770 [Bradyrhizobium diazoefficiens]AWO92595.1 hypothetical protein DI395_31570 [Bradyrhizobium diazoefficiens]KGJ66231.1 hypothetical protein BJA5080_02850 [Bradyrhizobium diazoefficiens SEMIA 5080]